MPPKAVNSRGASQRNSICCRNCGKQGHIASFCKVPRSSGRVETRHEGSAQRSATKPSPHYASCAENHGKSLQRSQMPPDTFEFPESCSPFRLIGELACRRVELIADTTATHIVLKTVHGPGKSGIAKADIWGTKPSIEDVKRQLRKWVDELGVEGPVGRLKGRFGHTPSFGHLSQDQFDERRDRSDFDQSLRQYRNMPEPDDKFRYLV